MPLRLLPIERLQMTKPLQSCLVPNQSLYFEEQVPREAEDARMAAKDDFPYREPNEIPSENVCLGDAQVVEAVIQLEGDVALG